MLCLYLSFLTHINPLVARRYQSITNWFQNQRSLAKKRRDDVDVLFTPASEHHGESRTYSGFPPPSNQPSLSLTQTNGHYSAPGSGEYRSPSISPSMDDLPHRSSRRSSTPYSTSASSFSRTRRSRPEPYQLDALKDLYTKTQAPSIEERTALALEIGMYDFLHEFDNAPFVDFILFIGMSAK